MCQVSSVCHKLDLSCVVHSISYFAMVTKRFARLFSKGTEERNHDLARVYREYFEHSVHPGNLAAFIDSYVRRTDLGISRSTPTSESCPAGRRLSMATTLQMPIINVCGALSPHQEDTVTLNSRLDPTKSSWMKVSPLHYAI